MPRSMMNGMTSHAFAAIMTATVVMFPSPEDLYRTVFPTEPVPETASMVSGGVERSFPSILTADAPAALIEEALDYCAADLSGTLPIHVSECQAIMELATARIGSNQSAPELASAEQKLQLTRSLYCRNLWADARRDDRIFDVTACQSLTPPLAEAI